MRSLRQFSIPFALVASLACDQSAGMRDERVTAAEQPAAASQEDAAMRDFKARTPEIIADYLRGREVVKVQIGSGSSRLDGWLNTDIEPGDGLAFLDATQRFPFDDGSVHYIFSEHVIEHLTYEEGKNMVAEAFRVLAPGGRMRIATPDLMKFIALFDKDPGDEARAYLRGKIRWHEWPTDGGNPAAIILNLQLSSWGHKFVYDLPTLTAALTEAGFANVQSFGENESGDENLRNIEGRTEGDIARWNRYETMIVEVEKPGSTTS